MQKRVVGGFTLIEVMVVIGIAVIIGIVGAISLGGFRNKTALDSAELKAVQDLRYAASQSVSGQGDLTWGIRFTNSTADYYEIWKSPAPASYASGTVVSRANLASGVTFYDPASGQVKDIIFARGTGLPTVSDGSSTVIFFNGTDYRTITVNSIGRIDYVNGLVAGPDVTPPAAPILTGTSPASPNQSATPTINGTAEANSTVTLYTNSGCTTQTGTPATATGGTFSIGVTVGSNTTTSFYAIAKDAANNPSTCSTSTVSYTNDVAPDAAPGAPDLKASSDSGVSNTDNITNTNGPLIFTVAPCVTGDTVTLYDNVTQVGTGTCSASTVDITSSTLASGTHSSINATQTDPAGNVSAASSPNLSVTIDTTFPSAPTSVAVTPVGGTVVANTLNGTNTNMTASATITAGQATGGNAVLKVGATTIATDSTIASGDTSVTFNLGTSTPAGLQAAVTAGGTVTVTLMDVAGNSTPSSVGNPTLTVDYAAPTVALTSSTVANGGTTSTTPEAFTATFSESVSNFVLGDISVTNGTASGLSGSGSAYTFSVTPTAAGLVSVSIGAGVANDTAGNTNIASSSYSFTYSAAGGGGTPCNSNSSTCYDPIADATGVSSDINPPASYLGFWSDNGAATAPFYVNIDEGIRQEQAPGTLPATDYIQAQSGGTTKNGINEASAFTFNTMTATSGKTIKLWTYSSAGSNSHFRYSLRHGVSGSPLCSFDVNTAASHTMTSRAWRSCSWTYDGSSLSDIVAYFGNCIDDGNPNTTCRVDEAYVEVAN